jgi:CHAT domain-containing protein
MSHPLKFLRIPLCELKEIILPGIKCLLPALLCFAPISLRAQSEEQTSHNKSGEINSAQAAASDARPLPPRQNVERDLRNGEIHAYTITLAAGQFWRATFIASNLKTELNFFAPGGARIISYRRQDLSEQKQRPVVFIAEASGAYRLEVRAAGKEKVEGRYRIEAIDVRAAFSADKSLFAALKIMDEAEVLESDHTAESNRQAAARYEKAGALLREAGERIDESEALNKAGQIRFLLAEYQQALDAFNQAVEAARLAADRQREYTATANIGTVYTFLGDQPKALDYYNRTLALAQALGNKKDQATLLSNIGQAYSRMNENAKALDYYNRALPLARAEHDVKQEASTLNNMASIFDREGESVKALDTYNQSLLLRRSAGDRIGEAATINNIAMLYNRKGENQRALDVYEQGLALCRAGGFRKGEETTLYGMANTLAKMNNLADARARIEEAIVILESIRTELVSQDLRASLRSSSEGEYKFYIDILMRLHAQNPTAGYDRKAFEVSERAHARSLLEQLGEARINLRQDVDTALLERERRIQQQLGVKLTAERALLSGEPTVEAAAAHREVDKLLTQYNELETQIRASSPRYAALTRPRLASVAETQQMLDADTLLLEFSLATEHSYLWVVSQNSIQSYMLANRPDIEKATRRFLQAMTARGERVRFETTDERQTRVTKADAEFPQAAADLSRMLLGEATPQLGNKRLIIVADGVLHYVPFAALAVSPAPTQSGENSSPPAYVPTAQSAAYRPLLAEHEIVSVPSASTLEELRRGSAGRKRAPKTIAVFADPVFDGRDERMKAISTRNAAATRRVTPVADAGGVAKASDALHSAREAGVTGESEMIPRLPFTRREADEIARLVPPAARFEALGFDAARPAATSAGLAQFRFVHFATHGFSNTAHPELSALVLSLFDREGRATDGFLTANDIFHLKLPAELIVLSGCRTGLGQEVKGEGLVGLTRGFMYAGAARVVVSLWDINDEATAELMARFYKGMLGIEGRTPAAALRTAQLALWQKKQWQAPYYWAAFVLQGEPR